MNTVIINNRVLGRRVLAGLAAAAMLLLAPAVVRADFPDPPTDVVEKTGGTQTAVLAGGCFWGMEGIFGILVGVYDVVSGYSGGSAATAHYELVGSGTTGHAESVEIVFDPARISYRTLLEVFFTVAHDPTQLNYQGPDHGTQYRSAIFYTDESQKETAEAYIDELESKGVYRDPIVTEVTPLEAFYPAESYHQDFMKNNPGHPYILYWDLPKVAMLAQEFPDLIAYP